MRWVALFFAPLVPLLTGGCSPTPVSDREIAKLEDGQVLTRVELDELEEAEAERRQREHQEELANLRKDAWFKDPPEDYDWEDEEYVDCHPVRQSQVSVAVALLQDRVAVALKTNDALALLDAEFTKGIDTAVLVRAFGTLNSSTRIKLRSDHALVIMDYLGSFRGAIRRPCVADLDRLPQKLLFALSGAI